MPSVKELEKRLRDEPDNLGLRVALAGAYKEAGRVKDAVELYLSVAIAYRDQGRRIQAMATATSILAIAPDDAVATALLAELAEPIPPDPLPPPPLASKRPIPDGPSPPRRPEVLITRISSSDKLDETPLPTPMPYHVADPTAAIGKIERESITGVIAGSTTAGGRKRPSSEADTSPPPLAKAKLPTSGTGPLTPPGGDSARARTARPGSEASGRVRAVGETRAEASGRSRAVDASALGLDGSPSDRTSVERPPSRERPSPTPSPSSVTISTVPPEPEPLERLSSVLEGLELERVSRPSSSSGVPARGSHADLLTAPISVVPEIPTEEAPALTTKMERVSAGDDSEDTRTHTGEMSRHDADQDLTTQIPAVIVDDEPEAEPLPPVRTSSKPGITMPTDKLPIVRPPGTGAATDRFPVPAKPPLGRSPTPLPPPAPEPARPVLGRSPTPLPPPAPEPARPPLGRSPTPDLARPVLGRSPTPAPEPARPVLGRSPTPLPPPMAKAPAGLAQTIKGLGVGEKLPPPSAGTDGDTEDELTRPHEQFAGAARAPRPPAVTDPLALSLFSHLPIDRRAAALARFARRHVAVGDILIARDDATYPFVLVLRGELEVRPRIGRSYLVGAGEYAGEGSMLAKAPARDVVIATLPSTILALQPADFYEIVAQYPGLWAELKATSRRRTMASL